VELTGGFTHWPNWPPAADSYGEDTVSLNYVLTGSNITIPDSGGSGYEEFYIKWEIEDYANNITEHIQTIRITDDDGPVIDGIVTDVTGVNQNAQTSVGITVDTPTTVSDNVSLDSDIELQYQVLDQDDDIGVVWTDATPDSTVTVTVYYPDSYSRAGGTIEYTVKWRATDQANNTTTPTTTTTVSVEFTLDTEPPKLKSTPSSFRMPPTGEYTTTATVDINNETRTLGGTHPYATDNMALTRAATAHVQWTRTEDGTGTWVQYDASVLSNRQVSCTPSGTFSLHEKDVYIYWRAVDAAGLYSHAGPSAVAADNDPYPSTKITFYFDTRIDNVGPVWGTTIPDDITDSMGSRGDTGTKYSLSGTFTLPTATDSSPTGITAVGLANMWYYVTSESDADDFTAPTGTTMSGSGTVFYSSSSSVNIQIEKTKTISDITEVTYYKRIYFYAKDNNDYGSSIESALFTAEFDFRPPLSAAPHPDYAPGGWDYLAGPERTDYIRSVSLRYSQFTKDYDTYNLPVNWVNTAASVSKSNSASAQSDTFQYTCLKGSAFGTYLARPFSGATSVGTNSTTFTGDAGTWVRNDGTQSTSSGNYMLGDKYHPKQRTTDEYPDNHATPRFFEFCALGTNAYADDLHATQDFGQFAYDGLATGSWKNQGYRRIMTRGVVDKVFTHYDDGRDHPMETYKDVDVAKGPGRGGTIAIIIQNFQPGEVTSTQILWYIGMPGFAHGATVGKNEFEAGCQHMACCLNPSSKQVEYHFGYNTNDNGNDIDYDNPLVINCGNIWDYGSDKDWLISISWRPGPFSGSSGNFSITQIGAQCIIKKRNTGTDDPWADHNAQWGGTQSLVSDMVASQDEDYLTGVPGAFDETNSKTGKDLESVQGLYIGGDFKNTAGMQLSTDAYDNVWVLVTADAQYFGNSADWWNPK
tara:strand:- start:83 stop:2851 length:2769 start_codon:yes stop_codon:yes gene_type:complete